MVSFKAKTTICSIAEITSIGKPSTCDLELKSTWVIHMSKVKVLEWPKSKSSVKTDKFGPNDVKHSLPL